MSNSTTATKPEQSFKSESILQKRWRNFKKIKRAYYSLIIIGTLYLVSFFNPILVNNKPLILKHNGSFYFPAFGDLFGGILPVGYYEGSHFGQTKVFGENHYGPPHFRQLKKQFKEEGKGNWMLMPIYPYNPVEDMLSELPEGVSPPTRPDRTHIIGLDNRGRDVFARLVYGFQISLSFALLITFLSYVVGILFGATLGYFGGKVDLYGVRLIEIFSGIPFLFTIMILVSFLNPSFLLLVGLLVLLKGWIGTCYFIRGEFFREKAKEYVAAATAMGQSTPKIMFKHILPNSLVPIITFAPFSIVGSIFSLVSLDYLGFGLRPPTPSWGELISQGMSDITYWWLIIAAFMAMFLTLMSITFIGEGARQAFDPREHSRLR